MTVPPRYLPVFGFILVATLLPALAACDSTAADEPLNRHEQFLTAGWWVLQDFETDGDENSTVYVGGLDSLRFHANGTVIVNSNPGGDWTLVEEDEGLWLTLGFLPFNRYRVHELTNQRLSWSLNVRMFPGSPDVRLNYARQ